MLEIDVEAPDMNAGRTPDSRSGSRLRNHPNLKDAAADFIREGIVSGRFGPGAKVDQDEIAGILGISRLPVREALIELAQKGYVTAVPRRGAFVVELGVEDIHDHYEVVAMAFALAARRAAKDLTPAQLLDLRSIHDEIGACDERLSCEALNREFNETINHAGSSPRLQSILGFLAGALPGRYYVSAPAWIATEAKYRERMLRALEARDADAAAAVAEEHIHVCAKVTVEELRARGYWTSDAATDRDGQRASQES